ncbi:MAG: DUF262 domain-containing protein [Bacteroidales bacterium]|jgi:hypothetical protein|nr:DUF262 domain-containing protein [Bacteroidales bacterium]
MSKTEFRKETFWSLLDSNKITIPIIQRSYSQGGRKTGKQEDETIEKKSNLFIERLCEALLNENPIELDFIYGSTMKNSMLPLDGQQRLTTLFLLHWYLAQKENKLTDEIVTKFKNFTYETRISAQYFCDNLCNYKINDYYQDNISETIRNQKWFVLSWENDPSVASMLGMLEKIDKKLRNEKMELWNKITRPTETAPITFFYTPLEDFNLTDDLYIKMNARGKELTGFENTKASFNKRIDDEEWDNEKGAFQKFGHKIDTDWTKLFWKFRNDKNKIDDYLLRFISAVLVNYYAGIDDKYAQKLYNKPDDVVPADLDKSSYNYLYNCFELYNLANEKLKNSDFSSIAFWFRKERHDFKNFNGLFKLFISKMYEEKKPLFTWQERILFYGFTLYLQNNKTIDTIQLSDWIIFIRNIIFNSEIDSYTTFISAKGLLDEIETGSKDIYKFLVDKKIKSGFAKEQMQEEIKKAKIYQNTPLAKPIIQSLENCNFCCGNMQFVFYCFDITDTVDDTSGFSKLKDIFYKYLNCEDISNDFRRALFTIGDTEFYYHRSTCWYLDEEKWCMIKDTDDLRWSYAYNNDNRKTYLKDLLLKLCDKDIDKIIKSFKRPDNMPNWKWRLITEPDLIEKCCSRHFTIADDNKHCYLLTAQKPKKDYHCIKIN